MTINERINKPQHSKNLIQNAFNKQASQYEQAAKVQCEIGNRLFERLDYLKINPRYILDLGCGTGYFSELLQKKYPDAQIVGVDLAFSMLNALSDNKRQLFSLTNADMNALPFADGVFDLVFSNQAIHWSDSIPTLFRELNRVMSTWGCLMFSTLGPDTFKEIQQAWASVDDFVHVNHFADMHDIGDALMHERFVDPVLDMEMLSIHYPDLNALLASLKAQGVRPIHVNRCHGLTGRKRWQQFLNNYPTLEQGKCPLSYEVVYGHAWKGEQRLSESGIETFIPISKIVRRRR